MNHNQMTDEKMKEMEQKMMQAGFSKDAIDKAMATLNGGSLTPENFHGAGQDESMASENAAEDLGNFTPFSGPELTFHMADYPELSRESVGDEVVVVLKGKVSFVSEGSVQMEPTQANIMHGKTDSKFWIQKAIKNKGSLRDTAARKGLIHGDEKMSMSDLFSLEKGGGKTAKRAHLAETLRKFH